MLLLAFQFTRINKRNTKRFLKIQFISSACNSYIPVVILKKLQTLIRKQFLFQKETDDTHLVSNTSFSELQKHFTK